MAKTNFGFSNANFAAWSTGSGVTFSTSTSSTRVALPTDCEVVTVVAVTQPAYIEIGNSSVQATTSDAGFSVYAPVGVQVDIPYRPAIVGGTDTHLSARVATSTGTLVICGRK